MTRDLIPRRRGVGANRRFAPAKPPFALFVVKTKMTTETPEERLPFDRVIPIFALTFVDVLGLTIILPLLHLYAVTFGASPIEIGLVAAAFPLSQLIGVPVMGALSDRYGRKPLLLISQITTFISFLMLAGASSLLMVVLSRVVDGLFGANLATAQAALSDITTEKTRAQGLGLTGAAFGLGFIIGPVIALISLEFSDSLATPALIAAGYSFLSILLTLFAFKETLPDEARHVSPLRSSVFSPVRWLRHPQINLLLVLMFAQQIIFFGFESLLGLFTLNRLGMLGQGNAVIFLFVGVLLVTVQVRFIGRWSRKYGEHRLVRASLGLIAAGLLVMSFTPQQPHPLYVQRIAENRIRELNPSSTERLIGEITVDLPSDENRGVGALLLTLVAIIPLSIGSGLIRPSLNSLMTKQVGTGEYGSILGASASLVSAANAIAPLLGGLIFQRLGATEPFLIGGLLMALLCLISLRAVTQPTP
jgi:MFS transporter, DHA1 family, tetracycline resistance protein